MKVNLNSISKRAQSFISEPKFLNSDIPFDFEVSLDKSDKILTVFYQGKSGDLNLLFSEALAIFSKNRPINELWKINFREIENFLRDENHLPAFQENLPEIESALEKVKISLIATVVKLQVGKELIELKSGISHWEKLNLVSKNTWAESFVKHLGWQFIFCDGGVLTVAGTPSGVSNEGLQLLFEKILETGEFVLPVKVVAVQ